MGYSCYLCSVVSLLLLASSWSVDAWHSFSILEYEAEDLLSEDRLLRLFESWQSKHGKLYHSLQEEVKRLEIFKKNLDYIDAHNRNRRSSKKRSGHWLGLNKFADLTNEEFKAIYSKKTKKPARSPLQLERPRLDTCDAPSSLDWRKKGVVTAVKDQGDCGSCWSFSSTGAIEGINAISTGDLISLSEQELVDCDSTNEGCDGGYMDYAFEWVIQNGGIDTEADYPYTGEDGTCNTTKEGYKVVTIDGYTDVAETDAAVLCAVVQQPVSVGMDGSAIDFQLYSGGIYDGDCSSDPDDIDHAVLIVGYSSEDDVDYWIVKNSWGTDWGLDGYFYIERNTDIEYGVCAINAMASYPTKEETSPSPEPSPSSTPPPPPPSTPPPPPPPPPPSPSPVECGGYSYCSSDETCCCIFELLDYCLIYGCCELENAVCCTGSIYCCPEDYPICDIEDGLCLQSADDIVGVEAKKRKRAHHKLPWKNNRIEETHADHEPSLRWRRHAVE